MKKLLVILLMFMVFTLLGCTAKFNFNDQKPVTLFNEGLIAFRSGDRWGYLNESEEVVIEAKYEAAGRFNDGEAIVKQNGTYNLIDSSGTKLLVKEYSALYRDVSTGNILYLEESQWGFMDNDGEILTDSTYDYIQESSQGIFLVRKNDKYGYVDSEGEEITDIKFETALPYSYELGVVKLDDKWGALDVNGKVKIDYIYDYLSAFDEYGRAVAAIGDSPETATYYLIDEEDNIILERPGRIFDQGPIYPVIEDAKYYLYDKTGSKFVDEDYLHVVTDMGYIVITSDGMGNRTNIMFNENGQIKREVPANISNVRKQIYLGDNIYTLSVNENDGLTFYMLDKTYVFDVDYVLFLPEGDTFICVKDNMFGMVDSEGNIVIDFEYEYLYCYEDGYCNYKVDDKWGILKSDYTPLFENTYDHLGSAINIYDLNTVIVPQ
jgi:hypothetical protein